MNTSAQQTRRQFLHSTGLSAAALPFLGALPSLGLAADPGVRRQRLVVVFTPNGTIPDAFWPDEPGPLGELKPILKPFEPFKDQMLVLKGISNLVKGDGDGHMRGIGCLLTGIELFPGNVQGGGDTPAGWSSGHSIDQELSRFFQANEATRTRFGSLTLGVNVPSRADTWTRMCYAGPNAPITPIDDPYDVLRKFYGNRQDQLAIHSVLDDMTADLKKLDKLVRKEDRAILDDHATFVREMERQLTAELEQGDRPAFTNPDGSPLTTGSHAMPVLESGVVESWVNLPKLAAMQMELIAHGFAADFMRTATLQITNSVGQAKMNWLDVKGSHHTLSHEPDSNQGAVRDLTKINTWYAEQVALLCHKLQSTPEPNGQGNLLDNTLVIWTNELGKGNTHTHDNIPFVCLGGGADWSMGRSLDYKKTPHNRLLLSIANAFNHPITTFGNPVWCEDGPLDQLV